MNQNHIGVIVQSQGKYSIVAMGTTEDIEKKVDKHQYSDRVYVKGETPDSIRTFVSEANTKIPDGSLEKVVGLAEHYGLSASTQYKNVAGIGRIMQASREARK